MQRQAVFTVKGMRAALGKVDEIVDEAYRAELVGVVAGADAGEPYDMRYPKRVERVDIGAVVDVRRVGAIEHAVTRKKDDVLSVIQRAAINDHVAVGRNDGLFTIGTGILRDWCRR
jgi:hypothetical protein